MKDVIYANVAQSMQVRILAVEQSLLSTFYLQVVIDALDMFGVKLDPSFDSDVKILADANESESPLLCDDNGDMTPAVRDAIRNLWRLESLKRCVKLSHEFQLNDSAS